MTHLPLAQENVQSEAAHYTVALVHGFGTSVRLRYSHLSWRVCARRALHGLSESEKARERKKDTENRGVSAAAEEGRGARVAVR